MSSSPSDWSGSGESEEDEDAALVTKETEAEVLRAFALIRARDPRIYDQGVSLYNEETVAAAGARWCASALGRQREAPLTLGSVSRQLLLEGQPAAPPPTEHAPAADEQDGLRAAIRGAFQSDDGGDLFSVCEKSAEQLAREDAEYRSFLYESLSADRATKETAADWFALRDNMSEDDRFLVGYVLNRGWIEREREGEGGKAAAGTSQRFRFEQAGSATVASHPRVIADSLRPQKEGRKKRRRIAAATRKAAEAELERSTRRRERMGRIERELDEELCAEPSTGGFRYQTVAPEAFGLSAADILQADDDLLNDHVPTKALAPFLPEEARERYARRYGSTKRARRLRSRLEEPRGQQ